MIGVTPSKSNFLNSLKITATELLGISPSSVSTAEILRLGVRSYGILTDLRTSSSGPVSVTKWLYPWLQLNESIGFFSLNL